MKYYIDLHLLVILRLIFHILDREEVSQGGGSEDEYEDKDAELVIEDQNDTNNIIDIES